jgi:hypothetical protein
MNGDFLTPEDARILLKGPDGTLYEADKVPPQYAPQLLREMVEQEKATMANTVNLLRVLNTRILVLLARAMQDEDRDAILTYATMVAEIGAFYDVEGIIPFEDYQRQTAGVLQNMLEGKPPTEGVEPYRREAAPAKVKPDIAQALAQVFRAVPRTA